MPRTLTYPTEERAKRLRIGGALYFGLGVILLGVAYATDEAFFRFAGTLVLVVGFGVSGYRHRVEIEPGAGVVETLKGFYFFVRRGSFHRSAFQRVLVRRSVRHVQQSSNSSTRPFESSLQVRYAVVLAGDEDVEVDATEDRASAERWAQEISEALDLPVGFEEEEATEADRARKARLQRWIGLAIALGVLASFGYVLYQLWSIG